MIHHVSIPAQDPCRVAEVLAEIFKGQAAPFTIHPGSYIAFAVDEHGTTIEVYPVATEMKPGEGEEQSLFTLNPQASPFTATHIAISVPSTQAEIEAIAQREGWRTLRCSRNDLFEVIEFWLENTVLIEFLPATIAHQYTSFMNPANLYEFLKQRFGIVLSHKQSQKILPEPAGIR